MRFREYLVILKELSIHFIGTFCEMKRSRIKDQMVVKRRFEKQCLIPPPLTLPFVALAVKPDRLVLYALTGEDVSSC